jgi:hypothetical protein
MFDRAGMKLGLDKAVMSRSGPTGEADNGQPSKHELSKQEIENLLKKGAYGAMLDDEARYVYICAYNENICLVTNPRYHSSSSLVLNSVKKILIKS